MELTLNVKNQSVESSGITKDYKEALCEFIWNGFEANATEVKVSYTLNSLQGIDTVNITDNGYGINRGELEDTFGAFLASQKNSLSLKIKSKANKGKGRFSFSAFSTMAVFHTVYNDNGILKSYKITLSNDNKQKLQFDDVPQIVSSNTTPGTTITFYNIFGISAESLSVEALEDYLLSEFAWYLYLNKHKKIKLSLNDTELDYSKHINDKLSETITKNIQGKLFDISLIVWNRKINEKFCCYYFDANNCIKGKDTTTLNRNTVDFYHSVFISSKFFNNWEHFPLFDSSSQVKLNETEETTKILKELKKEVQSLIEDKICSYMSSKANEEVTKMIEERKTFPKFHDDDYGELQKKI